MLPHHGGGAESYIDMLERIPGFSHERFYLSRGRSLASAIGSVPGRYPRLVGCLRAADLIHTHGDAASIIALPLIWARPVLTTTHGLHLLRRTEGRTRGATSSAMRAVASSAQVVICTSANERDELSLLLRPRDLHKLRVIYNGVDPPPVMPRAVRECTRAELGIGSGTILGLFAGQLEPRKAPLLAAVAARRVRAAGLPFALAIAGAGPELPAVRRLEGDAVRPLGYRVDIPLLMRAADVFVAPAEREGMSLALLEAMANGLAVVAADGPGNPETVGDAALLFETGDERALVAALTRVVVEASLRASLGAAARRRALELFTAQRFLQSTRDAYLDASRSATTPGGGAGAVHV